MTLEQLHQDEEFQRQPLHYQQVLIQRVKDGVSVIVSDSWKYFNAEKAKDNYIRNQK